jgi:hypothetical protein
MIKIVGKRRHQSTQISFSSVRIELLFWRLRHENENSALQRGIDLRAISTNAHVMSNPVLLGCVLRNLLTNPLRYTEPGGRVLIGCRRKGREISVLYALCNAHHLRELNGAHKMQRLLRRACHAVNLARERGVPLNLSLIELLRRRYDGILKEGIAFHEGQPALVRATAEGQRKPRGRQRRRTGHNLLLRLSTGKEDVLPS